MRMGLGLLADGQHDVPPQLHAHQYRRGVVQSILCWLFASPKLGSALWATMCAAVVVRGDMCECGGWVAPQRS